MTGGKARSKRIKFKIAHGEAREGGWRAKIVREARDRDIGIAIKKGGS
jgi:hypothetical protein